jgi:predicted permease
MCGLAAAIACGVIPAWRATRFNAGARLSRAGRGISSDTRSQRVLVGAQIAIAMLLLSSTGLMLRSYYNLWHVDAGFDASHAVTFHVGAAWSEDRTKIAQMQQRFVDELGSIPGVTAVGFSNFLPASNATIRYQVHLQGVAREESSTDRTELTVGERSVTSDYFRAIGARLAAGSTCPALGDVRSETPKALVNRRFLAAYAPGRNPQALIGRYAKWTQQPGAPMEIVGVLNDVREDNLRTPAVPYLYACIGGGNWPDPEYVVRGRGDPAALLRSIRTVVHAIAPTRAVFGAMPLESYVAETLGQTRLQTQMVAAFGLAAAALAAVGLYGLVALAVSTRRREIGIRIALGAAPQTVVRELASRAGLVIAAGAGVGLLVTAVAQRALRAVIFGVAPLDPATLLGAIVGLAVISAVATLLPASRAAKVDPVSAMRDS